MKTLNSHTNEPTANVNENKKKMTSIFSQLPTMSIIAEQEQKANFFCVCLRRLSSVGRAFAGLRVCGLLMVYSDVHKGIFRNRTNRFIAEVEINMDSQAPNSAY